MGVEKFYEENSESYSNPHAIYVKACLERLNLPSNLKVLDVGCGDGLVTKILHHYGNRTLSGIDKHMSERYTRETGYPCRDYSFEEISRGFTEWDGPYDVAVCSYMVDLIPASYMAGFFWHLAKNSQNIVTIRPNNHELDFRWLIPEKSFKIGKSCLKLYLVQR